MMDIFSTYSLYALIISNAFLIFGAVIALLRFERMVRKNRTFWNSPTGVSARNEANSDAVLSGFLERRLALLHAQVRELGIQLDEKQISTVSSQSVELPFEYATRMAKHGASVEDLTRSCGLKKAEAQLMRRLHAHSKTESVAH